MSFDAGSIIAHLDLDQSAFDRKLDKALSDARNAENRKRTIQVTAAFDDASTAKAKRAFTTLDQQLSREAMQRMRSSQGSVLGTLMALFNPHQSQTVASAGSSGGGSSPIARVISAAGGGGSEGGKAGSKGSGNEGGSFLTRLLTGIGPSVLGVGTKAAGIVGLGSSALGALPAIGGIGAVAGVGAAGAGFAALGAKELIGTKNVKGQEATQGPLFAQAQKAGDSLQGLLKNAATGMIVPLRQALNMIPSLVKGIEPALKAAFAGAGTLIKPLLLGLSDIAKVALPLLGQAFRAVAPLMRPLLDGLAALLKGVLPGLITIIRASAPAIAAFAQILGMLGRDLGAMFSAMAPAIRASSTILTALAGVLGGLFPIIGQLAAIFAKALAPVFVQLAGVIRALMPTLLILGHVLASFAGAVLGDLVSAFTDLAKLLVSLSPAMHLFAAALEKAFAVLENSGVFAILGNALAKILPLFGQLVNVMLKQLAPLLPVLITLLAQFANIMVTLLAAGLTTILQGLLLLIKHLPFLVPLLASAAAAWWLLNIAMDANPFGLVLIAIVALIGGITLLVTHWKQVWAAIRGVAEAAWNFIWNGIGKFLLPLLGPTGLIILGLIEVFQHWKSIWGTIKQIASDFNQWIVNDFGHSLTNFFTVTIPHVLSDALGFFHTRLITPVTNGLASLIVWITGTFGGRLSRFFTGTVPNIFRTATGAIAAAWRAIEGAVRTPVNWVITHVINDGIIHAFDWVSSKVGGPHIANVPGLAAGGKITKGTGPAADDVLARVSRGETVVSAAHSSLLAPVFAALGIPGYAAGGIPGGGVLRNIGHAIVGGAKAVFGGFGTAARVAGDLVGGGAKVLAALATGNSTALTNAIRAMIPGGVGGAVADMGQLLTDIPKTLVHDVVTKLLGLFGGGSGSSAKFTGKFGSGVAQWRGDVDTVLKMLGEPLSLANQVLYQMNTESGGNPNAINLTDSNAAAGDPSRGLLQTIMSTFEAYRSGALPNNIYNPMANIYAAVNYAIHRYGRTLMSGGMGMGSGHGYDSGGWLQPGGPMAWNASGRPEAVLTPSESQAFVAQYTGGAASLSDVVDRLEHLIAMTGRAPKATAAGIHHAMSGAGRRSVYAGMYGAR